MTRPRWLEPCSGRASGWRRFEPAELLAAAEREARRVGGVRPSDLSGLDRTGVPCWQVVRPQALEVPGNVTVLNGKGRTPEEARLGAWMELIERHWAERSAVPLTLRRPCELEREGRFFVPPAAIPLPLGTPDPGDVPLAWAAGTTFWGEEVLVPAHDVLCPFVPPPGAANPPIWRSAGLASGGHPTEAVFHGLLEILERDAVAVAELGRVGTTVDLAGSGSPWIAGLLERLPGAGVALEVKQVPAVGGVTAYIASLDDVATGQPMRLTCGHAAHVDPWLALERAVLEALQARAVIIAGAREDLDSYAELAAMDFPRAREELAWWLDPTSRRVPAPAAPLEPPGDLAEVVLGIERSLRAEGFQPLVVVELTPPGAPIAVVRVVVPTTSELSHGSHRLGRRFWGSRPATGGGPATAAGADQARTG